MIAPVVIMDETELTSAIVCNQRCYLVPSDVAKELETLRKHREELLAVLSEAQETIDMLAEDAEEAGYDARAHNACNLAMRCREAIAKAKGQP